MFEPSEKNNFLHRFTNGIARPAQGLGALARVETARALGVESDLVGFVDNISELGTQFILENSGTAASMALDSIADKSLSEHAGSMLTGAAVTGKLRAFSGAGFVSGGLAGQGLNVAGGGYKAAVDAFDALSGAGIDTGALSSETLARIGAAAIGGVSFSFDRDTNVLTGTFEHTVNDERVVGSIGIDIR